MYDASHPPAADRATTPFCDLARFGAGDADTLVAASFACPFCLHVDAAADVDADAAQGTLVDCRCRRCAAAWSVLVDEEQLLRLTRFTGVRHGVGWRLGVRFGAEWL